MPDDLEIFRAANQLIKRHGQDAELEAGRLADAMLAKGDLEGQRVWMRVLKAIANLRRDGPGVDEALH